MAYIKAISYYLPERVVSNEELVAEFPEWSVDKVAQKVGVYTRHVAGEEETAGDMAEQAARKLFAEHGIAPGDIDFVMLCTQSPDYFLPSTACLLQHRLGIPTVSLNVGVILQTAENIDFDCCLRSPFRSAREDMSRQVEAISSIFGGFIQVQNDYDGWNYSETSPLRDALRKVLAERGRELQEFSTHGGLETGIFKGRYPQMDIITYGPVMSGIHTPDEALDLASFLRSYENLVRVLEIV